MRVKALLHRLRHLILSLGKAPSRRRGTYGGRGLWYAGLRTLCARPELGDDFLWLAVTDDIAHPVVKSIVADTQIMVAALDALEQQVAVRLGLSDGDVVDEDG